MTECRATGHAGLQRRRDTAEGGAEFSFPASASSPSTTSPSTSRLYSHSEHRGCTALSRQQIKFHHTPHHSATRTTLISFHSSTAPLLIARPPLLHSFFEAFLPFFIFVAQVEKQKNSSSPCNLARFPEIAKSLKTCTSGEAPRPGQCGLVLVLSNSISIL